MKLLPEGAVPATSHPASLAIGVFDGVHLGHQAVFQRTLADAHAAGGIGVAVTFDRHPNAVVAPDRMPLALCPLWRKLDAFAQHGIEAALVLTFDERLRQQSAEDFVAALQTAFPRLVSVNVGAGFVFGHARAGDLDLLARLGAARGFAVHGLASVEIDGEVVSSTRLRELVAAGDFDRAARLLGRRHTLAGDVVSGARLGRQLGFPTANLDVAGLVLPPTGVYAGWTDVDGTRLAVAVNIGRRPTVDGTTAPIRVEAHLLGFVGDLYGRRLELDLHRRLRAEQRFPSREALVGRIAQDVAEVRVWAGNMRLP